MKKALLATIVGLSVVAGGLPAFAMSTEANAALLTELNRGSQGDTVKLLQALLASDPSIYPEGLISGTFGPLTAKAVMRFQKKHGLEQAGRVGPKTLQALRSDFATTTLATEDDDSNASSTSSGDGHGKKLCIPPGHLIAPGWLKKGGDGRGGMMGWMMGSTTGATASTTIPFCKNPLPMGIEDKMGSTSWRGDRDHWGTTTPPMMSVRIFGAAVSDMSSTTATVNWLTDKPSSSKVYYGTSNPLVLSTVQTVSSATLTQTHSLSITGLATSTQYYYVIESATASATATSTQKSFTTLAN